MLKIKKISPEDLDSLEFNMYKKLVKPLLIGTTKLHKDPNTPVDFFILTDFEFSDKPGKKTTIFIPGKQTAEWKKFLKSKFKEDKKNMMMGTCYVTESDGKQILNLSPLRGVAKMVKIKKQGKRMFAMARLVVQLASGAEELNEASGGVAAMANTGGRMVDDDDDDDDDEDVVVSTARGAGASAPKPDVEELKAQLKALADQINNIKKGVPVLKDAAAKVKNNTATADDAERVEFIYDEMESFLDDFEAAHQKVKERIAAAKSKVEAQLPQVAKLLERLQKFAPQSLDDIEDDEEEDEEEDNNIEITAELVQQLQQSMTSARTEINKLLTELNLDELLKEVA